VNEPVVSGRRSPASAGAQLAVGVALSAFAAAWCRLERTGDPASALQPRRLLVFNHKRDLDIPLLVRALLGPRTWAAWPGRLVFVGSSELYLPGFLALYFPQLGPLRWALMGLNLGPVLRMLRVLPVSTPGPRLLAVWLREAADIFGADCPLTMVLTAEWAARLAGRGLSARVTLAQALTPRYRAALALDVPPEAFQPHVRQRLALAAARRAQAHLRALATELEVGNVVIMAPEGNLSPDGRLQRFRSGLVRLLKAAPDTTVVPVGITYDVLAPGRPRAFLRVGAPLIDLGEQPRRDIEHAVRRRLAGLNTVTLAQLLGWVLLEELAPGMATIDRRVLAERVRRRAVELAGAGYAVDHRVLHPSTFEPAWTGLLAAARGGGLHVTGTTIGIDWRLLRGPAADWRHNPLAYARNELASMLHETGGLPERAPGGPPVCV
jgi:1-acyl-sn-glycerol-3-phosphate acyltransferase